MSDTRIPLHTRILYAPLGILLRFIGFLPLSISSPLGKFAGWTARHIIRYRLPLVRANLKIAFPQLSDNQREKIVSGFYYRLGQYGVETLHTPYMSHPEMRARMQFTDTGIIDSLFRQGRDIIIYSSHFGNWEWIPSVGLWCSYTDAKYGFLYRPLKNIWFDRFFLRLRSSSGAEAVKMRSAIRTLAGWRRDSTRFICGFLSDQKPSHHSSTVTTDFFGQETPFLAGTEELARKINAAVCYFDVNILAPGKYRSQIRLISDDPQSLPFGEITRRYASLLEATIRHTPEAYLWSHNRWRLSKKALRRK